MLDLEVQPERSLGNEQWELLLGMPVYQAVHILKKQDTVIKGVQLWYSEQNPLLSDLIINLSQDGIRLIFDSYSQRLKIIEVYNLAKVKLKYCDNVFNSPSVLANKEQIDQTFGATHPGEYHAEKQLFVLNFRGLSFEFKIETKFEPRYAHGLGSLQFRSGAAPVVSKMYIYTGNSLPETKAPVMPLSCFHGNCYVDNIDVFLEHGVTSSLRFTLSAEGNGLAKLSEVKKVTRQRTIGFGDTCQDVMSALGCPSKVYYKDEDKMRIHSAVMRQLSMSPRSDYFFNYFTMGVDVMFDARTHRVKKFVLHCNYPGHYDFNTYYRCKFCISLPAARRQSTDSGRPSGDDRNQIQLYFDTKWHSVHDQLVTAARKPVVLNRSSTTNTTNPFGSTFCYAVDNVIFEVMPNDHIATITVCEP